MRLCELYWNLIPYDWRLGQLWYRIKCFCWHRYTTVKPRYLDHTWIDRCDILPHMMFEILSQFIEEECAPGCVEWYGECGHKVGDKYVRDEMQELYDWWHQVYNKAYPKRTDDFWNIALQHRPDREWIPLEDGNYSWEHSWNNVTDEQLYQQNVDNVIKLEDNMNAQLKTNLHRLIEIMPYMWT